ncbi:MAG: hypothetical protein COA50_05230 [Flavobacteriaceae bacterium]|nr:MAG: hypothetical protein COA50_05230 [Flavobacteriaceae bacterium]
MIGFWAFSQNAITGYVPIENDSEWEKKVQLIKIDLYRNAHEKVIANAPIKENGYFSFDKRHLSNKNEVYRIYVNRIRKIVNDTVHKSAMFILSNTDSIRFKKGNRLFSNYENSNKVDAEWQRLRKFEAKLYKVNSESTDFSSKEYTAKMKSFAKDSLQILWVKLVGIKQLESNALLDIDIVENPTYYTTLLAELKLSDVNPSEYLFLENRLTFLTTVQVEKKYQFSKTINIFLGFVIAGLIFFIFQIKRKRNPTATIDLSKQEKNIQALILDGKSNKEIANELFISLSTVKSHITNIYNKLNVSNRKELFLKIENQPSTST